MHADQSEASILHADQSEANIMRREGVTDRSPHYDLLDWEIFYSLIVNLESNESKRREKQVRLT